MFGRATKCAKCNAITFETVEGSPNDCSYKLIYVQCAACKAPFGVTDYFNTAVLLAEQGKKIDALHVQNERLEQAIRKIMRAMKL